MEKKKEFQRIINELVTYKILALEEDCMNCQIEIYNQCPLNCPCIVLAGTTIEVYKVDALKLFASIDDLLDTCRSEFKIFKKINSANN